MGKHLFVVVISWNYTSKKRDHIHIRISLGKFGEHHKPGPGVKLLISQKWIISKSHGAICNQTLNLIRLFQRFLLKFARMIYEYFSPTLNLYFALIWSSKNIEEFTLEKTFLEDRLLACFLMWSTDKWQLRMTLWRQNIKSCNLFFWPNYIWGGDTYFVRNLVPF